MRITCLGILLLRRTFAMCANYMLHVFLQHCQAKEEFTDLHINAICNNTLAKVIQAVFLLQVLHGWPLENHSP